MSVNESKAKFEAARKAVSDCQSSIQTLQAKTDQLQDSLPNLSRVVEAAEKGKQVALDSYALHGDKQSESELRKARTAAEQAVKQRAEINELVEATARALKKQEQEFVRLNNLCELTKRECWQVIANEIKSAIPSEVFEFIKELQVIGSHCGQTRQWILDSLFQNPSSGEHQEIFGQLSKEQGID